MVNIRNWETDGSSGQNILFYGRTFNNTPSGVSLAALANGADSGAAYLKGVSALSRDSLAPVVNTIATDGKPRGAHVTIPTDPPAWGFNQMFQDLTWDSTITSAKIVTIGDWDTISGEYPCRELPPVFWVVNQPALSQVTGVNLSAGGFDVEIFLNTKTYVQMTGGMERPVRVIPQPVATTPWATALSNATHGVLSQFSIRFWSPNPVTIHTFVGDGTDTNFNLAYTPVAASQAKVQVFAGGTALTFNESPSGATQYSVNTTTRAITFGSAPTAGVVHIVVYQFLQNEVC